MNTWTVVEDVSHGVNVTVGVCRNKLATGVTGEVGAEEGGCGVAR
jgi:hypothetical protein